MIGIGIGILIACVLYRYYRGIAAVGEKAFGAGYIEGYDDAALGRDSRFKGR